MTFYGRRRLLKYTHRNLTQLQQRYSYRQLWSNQKYRTIYPKSYFFILPPHWEYVVLATSIEQHAVYLYSGTYFFHFSFPSVPAMTYTNPNTRLIGYTTFYSHTYTTAYFNLWRAIFKSFHRPFFRKVRFKGKGYYLYKNKRQTITPQFGYAHRLYLYAAYVAVQFQSKTHIFLFGLLKSDLIYVTLFLKNMRPISIFTGRGVRFSSQVIYKKVGKVSSYR
jgi:hypothetical protein